MDVKEELRDLVDRLDDADARVAIDYLRHVLGADRAPEELTPVPLPDRMGPGAVSGGAFFGQARKDLKALATEQRVRPVRDPADLRGDFWPEDEGPDDFVAALREWRREGGVA